MIKIKKEFLTCEACGEKVLRSSNHQLYCNECADTLKRQQSKDWYYSHESEIKERDRLYYLKNKERRNAMSRIYHDKHRSEIKEYLNQYYRNNKEKFKKYYEDNIIHMMWISAKTRARKFGLEFDITEEDIKIPKKCPFLDIPLFIGNKNEKYNSPSLDRMDNTKGYIKGNVQVISWRANHIKHHASFEEFEKIYFYWKNLIKNDENSC